ncbi:MAG: hypothetical protein ACLT4C_03150 [Butyricicoccus sp.]
MPCLTAERALNTHTGCTSATAAHPGRAAGAADGLQGAVPCTPMKYIEENAAADPTEERCAGTGTAETERNRLNGLQQRLFSQTKRLMP